MAVYTFRDTPRVQEDGTITTLLPQMNRQYQYHSITISFTSGEVPEAGNVSMWARRTGATLFEPLDVSETLDVTRSGGWPVVADSIEALRYMATNMPGVEYRITVNSFGD